jgi:hypothetical protein
MANKIVYLANGEGDVIPVLAEDNNDGTYSLGIKAKTPTFSVGDSLTRPANTTAYAANKSINCSVAVTALAYALKVVTLTAANAFAVGDHITVAGIFAGFAVTNIDGDWICGAGTNATTVVFTVAVQPTGTTPQTITVGTIAKMLSLDVAGIAGGGVILSEIALSMQGVAMTGAVRINVYDAPITALVDQATATALHANDAHWLSSFDLYPFTEGTGSDVARALWTGWKMLKCTVGDTRLYYEIFAEAAMTPVSGGVITMRASGAQLLG